MTDTNPPSEMTGEQHTEGARIEQLLLETLATEPNPGLGVVLGFWPNLAEAKAAAEKHSAGRADEQTIDQLQLFDN